MSLSCIIYYRDIKKLNNDVQKTSDITQPNKRKKHY